MKKLILTIITAIILTTVFTACNTQENTQETSETPTVAQSSETVVNKTSSQEEQVQAKTYVGKWKIVYNDIEGILTIKSDNTFDIGTNEIPSYSTVIGVSGVYTEENNNKIKLTAKEQTHYDSATKKTTTEKSDSSEIIYVTVKDNNTLIVTDENKETSELIRIN